MISLRKYRRLVSSFDETSCPRSEVLMSDPLRQLLLQKMMAEPSQEGAEPSFATSEQSPPNLLDMGVEGARGLISGFVSGMQPPDTPGGRIGEILGLGIPMAGMAKRTLTSGPAVDKLLGWLLEAKTPAGSVQQTMKASKATGFRVPPPPKVNIPKGFIGPPTNEMKRAPEIAARRAAQDVADANIAKRKPLATGARSGRNRFTQASNATKKLNEEKVREIRKMAQTKDLRDIYNAYPDVSHSSIRDVVKGDSWTWVK